MTRSILVTFLLFSSFAQATEFNSQVETYKAEVDHNYSFYEAAKSNNLVSLTEHIASGTGINVQDSQGYTALIYAAYYGNSEAVDLLLAKGADPCLRDKRGNSVLMAAVFKGNFAIAKTIMRAKCSVNQGNNIKQTPLMYASFFDQSEIAKALIKNGANVEARDVFGNTAAGLAEGQLNQPMLQLLMTIKTK